MHPKSPLAYAASNVHVYITHISIISQYFFPESEPCNDRNLKLIEDESFKICMQLFTSQLKLIFTSFLGVPNCKNYRHIFFSFIVHTCLIHMT